MSDKSTRPIAGHTVVMALIAWSMFVAVGGVVSGGPLILRVLCLVWVALGAWLLVRRWRSRP